MSLSIFLHGKLKLLILLCQLSNIITTQQQPICCFPKQFESHMYVVNTGREDKTGLKSDFGILNGTFKTAYDSINKRTYFSSRYTVKSPDDPRPAAGNVTELFDYKTHICYIVAMGQFCIPGRDDSDFLIECIPNNATLVGEGYLADTSTVVQTYLTTFGIQPDASQIMITVINTDNTKGECMPVQFSNTNYPIDKEANIIASDVYDVTKGIKDESIFTPPPACNKSEVSFPWRT